MITYAEALAMLLREAEPIHETETIPLMYSTGRVLAEDVTSMIDVPGWDNSQMDGYCLRAADLASASENAPVRLPVAERIAAGKVGVALEPGTCARIFTGAPMPEGADTVVPQEEVERDGDMAVFRTAPKKGAWVRRQGSDVAAGSVILKKGVRMTPGAIGMTASIGRAYVTVYRKLRVGVFFSGDELVQPGEPLRPGGIYNSNRFMIRSLLTLFGCEATDLGSIPDSLEATKRALENAAETSDVIMTTGGMSVGEEDHIKPAVEALGRIDLWRVKLKPGKPLAFGEVKGVPFIGLPGNPVSGFVVCLMMARQGRHDADEDPRGLRLGEARRPRGIRARAQKRRGRARSLSHAEFAGALKLRLGGRTRRHSGGRVGEEGRHRSLLPLCAVFRLRTGGFSRRIF